MSILVVGSVALDTIKTPLEKGEDILGGSATYFSLSAHFFKTVKLVAVVGSDFPHKYINLFKEKGIDLRGLAVKKGETFRWKGEYGWDFGDPRTISTCLNVFSDFKPYIPKGYRKSKYLFLANIDPQLQCRVLKQVAGCKLVVCDTMNYWIKNKRQDLLKLLKKVDIFLLNVSEARQLTGETNLIKIGRAIARLGPAMFIIKKGEDGALLFLNSSLFCVPAFLLESVRDPTGAGDTFAGGVVGYLATCKRFNKVNLKKAVIYGTILATFAVEGFGVEKLLAITKADIKERLRQFKKRMCF
jgi:sugar/nucleoside kinase (ribokinase family)